MAPSLLPPPPPPALAPPAGQATDYAAPDDLWQWNILCQAMCMGIPGIMFLLRTYVRAWVKRVWILEDYLCCYAYIGLVVYGAFLTTIISKHGGNHEWDVTAPEVMTILYYVNIVQIWYGPVATAIKAAILLLYLRVFSPHRSSGFAILIKTFVGVVCCFYFALTVAKICQCLPRERIWNKAVPGTCVSLPGLLDSSGSFNIASDVLILLVPLKGVWNLQMSRLRKVGIYAIFTVGIVAPIFSIIGLVKRLELTNSPDQSYNQPIILLWAEAELATGVMVICLPTLPGILQRRQRRPSISIINGSGKSRPRYGPNSYGASSTEDDAQPLEGGYYELQPGRPAAAARLPIQRPPNGFVNEIRGGDDESRTDVPVRAGGRDAERAHGIIKSVKIEQGSQRRGRGE